MVNMLKKSKWNIMNNFLYKFEFNATIISVIIIHIATSFILFYEYIFKFVYIVVLLQYVLKIYEVHAKIYSDRFHLLELKF